MALALPYTLRVSVLEQCQFRCPYCLPGSLNGFTQKENWLTAAHYLHFAHALKALAVPLKKIRFTGGEPLLRPDLPNVVAAFRSVFNDAELCLTTNGKLLPRRFDQLVSAGLRSVNLHIDTLKDERYQTLMGSGSVSDILTTLRLVKPRLTTLKINVVVQKNLNDDELCDFLDLSKELGVEVRFIELMNTGSAQNHVKLHRMSGKEIVGRIAASGSVRAMARRSPEDPAALYFDDARGIHFGVIASDSEPFCAACRRLRLTAFGRLKGCMYEPGGMDFGSDLRQQVPLEMLCQKLAVAIASKASFHPKSNRKRALFSMADIGG